MPIYKNLLNIVCLNIRSARLERKLSQEYLAAKLNISQNAYSKIELGHTKLTLNTILRLAELYNIEILELLLDKPEV